MKEALDRLSGMDPSDDMGEVLECVMELLGTIESDPEGAKNSKALDMIREKEKASREYFMRPFDSDEAYNRLISVHKRIGEDDTASVYSRCLDLRQARKWTILGDSYALMGLNKRASDYLKRALYFGPTEDLVEEVQKAYDKASKRVEKAQNGIDTALNKALTGNVKNTVKAVGMLLDLDRNQEALEIAEKGLKTYGEDFDLLYRKGVALFGIDEFKKALEVFERTIEMRPNSANAKRGLNLTKEMMEGSTF